MSDPAQLSQSGMDLIKSFEGCVLFTYDDSITPPRPLMPGDACGGTPTIGYGHTGSDVVPGLTWTQSQADATLNTDLLPARQDVSDQTADLGLASNQFSALAIFAFNIGIGGFNSSHALQYLCAHDFADVPGAMMLWTKTTIDGQKVNSLGLERRRYAETQLFALPDGAPSPDFMAIAIAAYPKETTVP